ncbi:MULTISPECIES: DUF983 domain-containing protein [Flagellimonas]|uniref:DUF983 domain-containing protein n=1 Tax=Flagellimonas hadalis TaxID=2597517 RepID=A0A5N5IQB3_9FLAO|nr:DUF983 domain-containing protein [Allomuricauda hadalis]KAB5486097.1 DUF983 domain-containing protein [Allomuricauda hadalis]RUA18152.1 MAG: DUF983 domain-containing protein [Flavobacteriia bacterium]
MSILSNIATCKCPNCRKSAIFNPSKGYPLRIPRMYERCQNCHYKFERETGFFFGAMFVSYALAAAEMISVFVVFWYFFGLRPLMVFILVAIMASMLSTFNFKWSRTIWIYLFYKR